MKLGGVVDGWVPCSGRRQWLDSGKKSQHFILEGKIMYPPPSPPNQSSKQVHTSLLLAEALHRLSNGSHFEIFGDPEGVDSADSERGGKLVVEVVCVWCWLSSVVAPSGWCCGREFFARVCCELRVCVPSHTAVTPGLSPLSPGRVTGTNAAARVTVLAGPYPAAVPLPPPPHHALLLWLQRPRPALPRPHLRRTHPDPLRPPPLLPLPPPELNRRRREPHPAPHRHRRPLRMRR